MDKTMYKKLRSDIIKKVPKKRMAHTLGVETSAMELAKKIVYDAEKVSIAACLHDCCKDIPDAKLLEYIKKNSSK